MSSNLSSEINEQITHDLKRYLNIRTVTSARFTSDGKHIVFLTNITGIPQLWTTEVERDDEESNRSTMMMELLSVDNTERVSLSEITGDMLLSSKKKDLIAYGTDAGGNERHQIYVIESLGERLRKITDRPNVVHCLGNFSNDGKRICYSSNQRNQTAFDLYVQDTDGSTNSGELIYQGEGTNYPVEWSPKDNAILFKTIVAPFNHDLYLLDLSTLRAEKIVEHQDDAVFDLPTFSRKGETIYCLSNARREFTALAEISLANHKLQYVFEEKTSDIELLKQSPNARYLAFTVNSNGYSKLKILSTVKTAKVVSELLLPKKSIVLDLDWSPDSSRLSLVITSSTLNTDVWTYDISKKELRRITQISASGIPRSSFPSTACKFLPTFTFQKRRRREKSSELLC
jgi:Tol biopolymer transport system component